MAGLRLSGPVVTSSVCYSMVHEAALPKPKQHVTKAAKAKREEMLKHAEASAPVKDNLAA